MNDTLRYMGEDPVHRRYHHDKLTFGLAYAFSENFVLPLSHDEVVHGKGSILARMPGDEWQRFANLRAYYGFMWGHPGKKLLFMGCEFGSKRVERRPQPGLAPADHPQHAGRPAPGARPECGPAPLSRPCTRSISSRGVSSGSRTRTGTTRCFVRPQGR
jgi:hypothetical protein